MVAINPLATHARLTRIRKYIHVLQKEEKRLLDQLEALLLEPRPQFTEAEDLMDKEYKELIQRGILNEKDI